MKTGGDGLLSGAGCVLTVVLAILLHFRLDRGRSYRLRRLNWGLRGPFIGTLSNLYVALGLTLRQKGVIGLLLVMFHRSAQFRDGLHVMGR